jgi:hypothetical protein
VVLRRIHPSQKRGIVTALSPVGTTVADRLREAERRIERELPLPGLLPNGNTRT